MPSIQNSSSLLFPLNTKLFSVYEPVPLKKTPLVLKSKVVKGYGRGSKELGCPTANLEDNALTGKEETGVWMGFAKLNGKIYKCVASIGWNPFYKNSKKTCEPHLLHKFDSDFYGEELELVLSGYIREERDFSSAEDLKIAIDKDIQIAEICLDLPQFSSAKTLLEKSSGNTNTKKQPEEQPAAKKSAPPPKKTRGGRGRRRRFICI